MMGEILSTLDVIGLGMLLGGGVYESVVMAPNYRSNLPRTQWIRWKVRGP